jgi:hypothetical protein
MTTAAFPADLGAQARAVHPGRAIATLIIGIFAGIGWILGTEITGLAFCAVSVRYGYRLGHGLAPAGQEPASPPDNGPSRSRPGKL